jgi:MFS family permease
MSRLVANTRYASRGALALYAMFGALYLIQGANETATGLVTQPVNSILKNWGMTAPRITTFVAILELPWCLKPLFGLLTDFVPLAGFQRKSYLIGAAWVAGLGFLTLFFVFPAMASQHRAAVLLICLLLLTAAVAFGDVVLDASLIEAGQPRQMTGRLQSVRWGASYLATIVTASLGGVLCETHRQRLAFLICGGLALTAMLMSAYVREPAKPIVDDDWPTIRKTLATSLRSRTVVVVGLFLFVWHFNPFSQSVLYLHMTKTMRFSEEFYGRTISLLAVGSLLACIGYGLYCQRISMRWLVPLAIVCGVLSTLVYAFVVDRSSAVAVSLLSGFFYMTGNMVQCDLAARACPPRAAGTVFAIFMSLCNFSMLLSTALGGHIYQAAGAVSTSGAFFSTLVIGAALTLCSWPIAICLPRAILVNRETTSF